MRYCLFGIILLSPLPLGLNRPEIWNFVCILIGILGIFGLVIFTTDRTVQRKLKFLTLPGGFTLIFLIFVLLQSADFLGWLGNPIWKNIALIGGEEIPGTISINPSQSISSLLGYTAYIVVFFLAFITTRRTKNTLNEQLVFLCAGIIYATYGLIIYFSGNQKILWFDKWAYLNDLTSVFVNRNTYATFCGFIIVCSITCMFAQISNLRSASVKSYIGSLKGFSWPLYISILAFLLNTITLFLTHSRGGLLASICGVLCLCFIILVKHKERGIGLSLAGIALFFLLGFGLFLSGETTIQRISNTSVDTLLRDEAYQAILVGIKSSPWLGTGFGTFEDGFKTYYTESLNHLNWTKAHNTYLEIFFELGLIFGIVFFIPLSLVLFFLLQG